MNTENKVTIESVQKRLDSKGVCDIKVFWSNDEITLSDQKHLLNILESYLNGNYMPLGLFGDKNLINIDNNILIQ